MAMRLMNMRAASALVQVPRRALLNGAAVRVAQPSSVRMLRTTPRAAASEDPRGSMESAMPPGFEKLGESPEALAAINRLMEVLQKHGVDVSSGAKPSMFQLAKLATNAEVRDATAKGAQANYLHSTDAAVAEEMRKAGVDLSPERMKGLMGGMFGRK